VPTGDYTAPQQSLNSGPYAATATCDFETYWRYHLGQEQRRVQQTRYADNLIPKPHEVPSEEPHPNHLGRLR